MTARTARLALGALACAVALGGCMSSEASFEPLTAKPTAQRKQPVRVYVDQDSIGGPCNDSRPVAAARAATTPWCSLARAVDSAPSGSTILVRRGSYPRLTIQGERRTRFVTIRSAPHETATLNGFTATNSSYWRFQGLRFAGASNLIFMGNDHIDMIGNDLTVATQVRPSLNIRFIDNRVHDLPGPPGRPEDGVGIWVVTGEQGPIRNVLIRGNTFSRLPNDAIFTDADRVTVEHNEFDHIQSPDNNWAHADVFQGMGANFVTIRDNFAHDNDSGILETIARVRGWVIENNVFLRSESWPLQLDNELRDLKLVNNTFWGGGPVLLRWNDQQPRNPSRFIVVNNIFNRLDYDLRLNLLEGWNIVSDNFLHNRFGRGTRVGVTPRFADPGRDDYRLAEGSPGIDAGTSAFGAPRRDRAGAARRDDRAVPNRGAGRPDFFDIGAYERTGR
jgi:hypothetical protein